jgi:hypothetical protein
MLDQVKAEHGLPKVIRADNGPEFAWRTMQTLSRQERRQVPIHSAPASRCRMPTSSFIEALRKRNDTAVDLIKPAPQRPPARWRALLSSLRKDPTT